MQSMNEDKLNKDINKITGRLCILRKKKKLWGLTDAEDKELNKLLFVYMKNFYQLIDVVFVNYIEPFLYNDRIVDLKETLMREYGWEGGLLFFDKDISELFSKVDDKKHILEIILELKKEELKMSTYFESSKYGEEVMELFSALQNDENEEDCITKYIELRYDIMITMIEEV